MFKDYNWQLWRKIFRDQMNGKKPDGNEPLPEWIRDPNGRWQLGIFVDADIFHDWKDWKQQATIAKAGHLLTENITGQGYMKRPDAEPIATAPLFLFEQKCDFLITWINATVSDEIKWQVIKQQAEDLRTQYFQIANRYGKALAKAQLPNVTWASYDSDINTPGDIAVFVEQFLKS